MNFPTDRILDLSWTHVWQLALLTGAVLVVASLVKRRHPHLVYLLWMLVLLKSMTPPLWSSPTAVFGRFASSVESSTSGTTIENSAESAEPSWRASAAVPSGTSGAALSSATLEFSPSLLLVEIWASGSVFLFVFFILKHWRHCRGLIRESLLDDRLQTLTERLARTLGLKKTPRLLLSSSDCGPSAFGVFQPSVVLPKSCVRITNVAELEPVIAHELIHLRRRDPLAAWLQLVAVCLNWWNPLVWWSSRSATRSREDCCDQEVLGSFQFPPEKYAQALIEVLRNTLSRPAPLVIAALPLTQDRIRNIMTRHKSFLARSPRWCWIVILLLAIAVLPAGSPADDKQNSTPMNTIPVSALAEPAKAEATAEEEPAMEVPQLTYLAWSQKKPKDKNSKTRVLWTPEGRIVSEADVNESIAEQLHSFTYEQKGLPDLESITLFFEVDERLTYSPIFPTVLAEGKRGGNWFAMNSDVAGLSFTCIALRKREFDKWPDQVSLEIKYPIENPTIIKTLKEIPDEPVDIAEGITWYLDPNRASVFDRETKREIRVENKSAAVLQILRDRPDQLTAYSVRVYLKDQERPLQRKGVTIIEPNGQRHAIRFSNPVDPAEIERIEVIRQRYDIRLIRDIPIKTDLIPKAE